MKYNLINIIYNTDPFNNEWVWVFVEKGGKLLAYFDPKDETIDYDELEYNNGKLEIFCEVCSPILKIENQKFFNTKTEDLPSLFEAGNFWLDDKCVGEILTIVKKNLKFLKTKLQK